MKKIGFTITILKLFSLTVCAQYSFVRIINSERNFHSEWRGVRIPCAFKAVAKCSIGGLLIFHDKDSTAFAFDYFSVNSLPFFDSTQSEPQTGNEYYKWISQRQKLQNDFIVSKVEENYEEGFIILKVSESFDDYYWLIGRHNDLLWSIKTFDCNGSAESQLVKLKILFELNSDGH